MDTWPFMPQREFVESLAWLTDILDARGKEQRLALRQWPRMEVEYQFLLSPAQVSQARLIARKTGADRIYVPLWADFVEAGALTLGQTVLSASTANMRLASKLMVWQDCTRYELADVQSFTGSSITLTAGLGRAYASAVLVPVAEGYIAQGPTFERTTNDYVRATIRLQTIEKMETPIQNTALTHRGYDIYLNPNIGSYEDTYEPEAITVDSVTGEIDRQNEFKYPRSKSVLIFNPQSRAEMWSIRAWLQQQKGRFKAFWAPTWNNDIPITQDITNGDSTITGQITQFEDFAEPRDLLIVSAPVIAGVGGGWGTNYGQFYGGGGTGGITAPDPWANFSGDVNDFGYDITTVLSSTVNANDETYDLIAPTSFGHLATDIVLACYLYLYRFDSDRIEIQYKGLNDITINIPLREVKYI